MQNLKSGETADVPITAKVSAGATQCVKGVEYGKFKADAARLSPPRLVEAPLRPVEPVETTRLGWSRPAAVSPGE